MFEQIRKWLSGTFICIKCEKEYHIFSFGFGLGICPDCYTNEKKIIFIDNSYFLNRLVIRLAKKRE